MAATVLQLPATRYRQMCLPALPLLLLLPPLPLLQQRPRSRRRMSKGKSKSKSKLLPLLLRRRTPRKGIHKPSGEDLGTCNP